MTNSFFLKTPYKSLLFLDFFTMYGEKCYILSLFFVKTACIFINLHFFLKIYFLILALFPNYEQKYTIIWIFLIGLTQKFSLFPSLGA